jgi:hypothetical protein
MLPPGLHPPRGASPCFIPRSGLRLGFVMLCYATLSSGFAADVATDIEFAYQALGRALRDGRHEDGLAICRLAAALQPEDLRHPYNAACCEARLGRTEAALTDLEQSLRLGFNDLELLRTDEDLASLRSHPRFKRAVKSLERTSAVPAELAGAGSAELRNLAGKWVSQSMRNDYDDGSYDRGRGEDYTALIITVDGMWRYGNQTGKLTLSDVSAADLAFMDFKPTDNPKNLPKRKFELLGWAGGRAMCFWRIDEADGKPYRILLHFRVSQPRPGLATWIRSRASS